MVFLKDDCIKKNQRNTIQNYNYLHVNIGLYNKPVILVTTANNCHYCLRRYPITPLLMYMYNSKEYDFNVTLH